MAIVGARMGSSRLPGKVLLPLAGRPVLWHILHRLADARSVDATTVATSDRPRDDVIARHAASWGADCFRGPEEDVLARYYLAAQAAGAGVIVRVPADKPLVDPFLVDEVVEAHLREGADYTTNMPAAWPQGMTFPFGLEVEVVGFGALARAHQEATAASDREHGLTYIYRHPEIFKITRVTTPPELASPEFRLALDTPEDYDVMQHVYTLWRESDGPLDVREVLAYLTGHPDVAARNRHVVQRRV